MIVAVKLSEWAKANGVSRQSACRWFHAGVLPVPARQFRMDIAGGAVYDALVALAAVEHKVALATRDARARDTYETLGVEVVIAG